MKPKYQQLADEIRSKILSKEYPLDSAIPPEMELQEKYQVSRHTVRQAIAMLVSEGFLRRRRGSGTFVDAQYISDAVSHPREKVIGVITTYLSDYIFPSIIRGIEGELKQRGYSLLLASTNNDLAQEKKCLENMQLQHVDGLIVEPTKSNQLNPNIPNYLALKKAGVPMVMINAYYEMLDIPYICIDDVKAGFLATSFMIGQGHHNLALIVKSDDLQGKLRMKGFVEACEQAGISFESENVYTFATGDEEKVVADTCKNLLKQENNITGIVCYNDQIANLLSHCLVEAGKKIPEDYSIIGQDDSYLSTAGEVKLTTVTHPKEVLGTDAAKWIIEAVEKKTQGKSIIYTPEIVARNSVLNILQR